VSARKVTGRPSANGHRPPRPADWKALQYQPAEGTPLLRCDRRGCGAAYVNDEPSRQAHVAVFGHSPRPAEPAKPPQETTPS
jgi:hypothetical protein